jgi:hypothetical protein
MKKIGRLSTLYDSKHKYKTIKDIRDLGELDIITIHPSSVRSDILEDPQLRTLSHLKQEAIKRLVKQIKMLNASPEERTEVIKKFNDYVVNYHKDDLSFVNTGKKGIRKSPRGQTRKSPRGLHRPLAFDNQVERLLQQTSDAVMLEDADGKYDDWALIDLNKRLNKLKGVSSEYDKKFYDPDLGELKTKFEQVQKGSPRFSPRLQERLSFDDEVAKLMDQTGDEVRLQGRDGKFDDWKVRDIEERLGKLQGRSPRYKINSSAEPTLEELQDIFDNLGSGKRTKRKRKKSGQKRKTKQKRRRKH